MLKQSMGLVYLYLHLPQKSTIHVGKYTSPMDDMAIAKPAETPGFLTSPPGRATENTLCLGQRAQATDTMSGCEIVGIQV